MGVPSMINGWSGKFRFNIKWMTRGSPMTHPSLLPATRVARAASEVMQKQCDALEKLCDNLQKETTGNREPQIDESMVSMNHPTIQF